MARCAPAVVSTPQDRTSFVSSDLLSTKKTSTRRCQSFQKDPSLPLPLSHRLCRARVFASPLRQPSPASGRRHQLLFLRATSSCPWEDPPCHKTNGNILSPRCIRVSQGSKTIL